MYLIERDFQKVFNTSDMATVLKDPTVYPQEILNNSIDFAIDFVKSKIQHRYDPDKIFIDVNTFDLATNFSVGDLIVYIEAAYVESKVYVKDERVSYSGIIYSAKKSTTGNLPTDTTNWTEITTNYSFYSCILAGKNVYPDVTTSFTKGDTRHTLIKDYCIYLAIDNMMPHVAPRTIPNWLLDKKEMAEAHLNRINSGKDTVILPLYEDADGDETDAGASFSYGSNTKRTLDY